MAPKSIIFQHKSGNWRSWPYIIYVQHCPVHYFLYDVSCTIFLLHNSSCATISCTKFYVPHSMYTTFLYNIFCAILPCTIFHDQHFPCGIFLYNIFLYKQVCTTMHVQRCMYNNWLYNIFLCIFSVQRFPV